MVRHAIRFGVVGGLASLIHMLIGVTLIHSGWSALLANPVAFVIAFGVSFLGHYGFTFTDQRSPFATSLIRFAVVACGGFALNESLLALLVWTDAVSQMTALVISTASAAAVTFFASKNWAFNAGRPTRFGTD